MHNQKAAARDATRAADGDGTTFDVPHIVTQPTHDVKLQWTDLLRHLGQGGTHQYYWTAHDKRSSWFACGKPPAAAKRDCYFGVHPTAAPRGTYQRATLDTIAAVNALFAEFDDKDFQGDYRQSWQHIHKLDPCPSVIVRSGGGWHCYWLLDEPFVIDTDADRKRARELQYRWVGRCGGDGGAKDLARVLRVPGTLNGKYTPARPVYIAWGDIDRLYTLDQLEKLCAPPAGSYIRAAINGEAERVARSRDGSRNTTLYEAALKLGGWITSGAASRAEIEAELTAAAASVGLPQAEAARTIASGLDTGAQRPRVVPDKPKKSKTFKLDDIGNGERMAARHGHRIHWVPEWGWLVWDGRRWKLDAGEVEISALAKETARSLLAEAAACDDEGQYDALLKHARRTATRARRQAMVDDCASEPGIAGRPEQFDQDPFLLNVANGTVDLRTGHLHPHNPDDKITKIIDVPYNPDAQCPIWQRTLDRIMGGNGELIGFLQRAVGYSLSGNTGEQVFFLTFGTGANGKTTFLETIMDLLGDYGRKTDFSTFLERHSDGPRNDLAALRGVRYACAIEAAEGQRLAESVVKQLTGSDTISARFLFREFFQYRPAFKLWLAANHKPIIRGTDHAIWRRVRLIPFLIVIPEEEQDRELPAKLKQEFPGILAWCVRGCLAWQSEGLGYPEDIRLATEGYRAEMDVVGQFLDDCCTTDATSQVKASQLYERYQTWCTENGERPMKGTMFGRRLAERGLDRYRQRDGVYYLGLALAT